MNLSKTTRQFIQIFVFTVLAVSFSLSLDYRQINSDFNDDVDNVNRVLTQQLTSVETVLVSLAGLHHASDDLNQAELSSFSEAMLKAYPFIDRIIGLEKVKSNETELFESRMHQQGYVGLMLTHKNDQDDDNERSFHLPINFIEPMTPNSVRFIGLDIRSLENMAKVTDLAINSGEVVATTISEILEPEKMSFMMFKALYLGRYPPNNPVDRREMMDSLVALEIKVEHFVASLGLGRYELIGQLENYKGASLSEQKQKLFKFEMFLTAVKFEGLYKVYGRSYILRLQRNITPGMFNKLQMVLIWLASMLLLMLLNNLSKKRKAVSDEIRYLAYFDALTALPNRESFKDKLALAVKDAQENNTTGAVLFMDIDEFKRINDTLGHDIGDELLRQVSKRLIQQMRPGDSISLVGDLNEKDIVTRLGGDEFTVLLADIKNEKAAGHVANRILEHIAQPFNLNGHEVYVTSSIGIALFPDNGEAVDKLLKHADTAMYHAKDLGKNNFQFYHQKMSSKIERRLQLEGKLHQALRKEEFQLYYQPQIDAKTEKIIGAEALIRWNQSDLGMIFPDDFIPLAEETGQIIKIGEWVINEACQQTKAWQDKGYTPIRVSVNLSGLQFMQENLIQVVAGILKKTGLSAQFLELEITESIMMRNIEQSISTIRHFNKRNIAISVDDFGTGYSSLSYLKKFPLESLKIDKSFVMDIPDDKDDMMITSAIISMAKSLNLKVVAEGVENQQQLDFLKQHDCDVIQGYYFSKPVPAAEFEVLLKKQYLR